MQKEFSPYESIRCVNYMQQRWQRAKRWRNAVKPKDKNAILLEDMGERITRRRNRDV